MTAPAPLLSLASLPAVAVPRVGVVTGLVLTRDGVPAAAVRVAAIPAPPADARPEDGTQYYEPPPPVRSRARPHPPVHPPYHPYAPAPTHHGQSQHRCT